MRFHRKCGDRVTLLNENTTAVRNFVEFNHGLVISAEPLEDDVPFEVSIDRKVNVWNGSLEIGVTTIEPNNMELPATATKLRNTAWIMSGRSVVKDGVTLVSAYGPELDTLREGDSLGVMKSSKGELIYYINNRSLGVAAKDLPSKVFAVVDLYGQCVQVSIINSNATRSVMDASGEQVAAGPNNDDSTTESDVAGAAVASTSMPNPPQDVYVPMEEQGACALVVPDPLRFHIRCGILIVLSCNNKTAERVRPLDDYNNGVVMTHRPLHDNELFEVRVDKLVDKWSGSIEMGVTTHNPATMRFPSTMTNMESGTIMMSGCKVLVNGHGTNMEFGNFNLDDLREGDSVGMMRKCNGKLHYFINGVDQGVASDKVAEQIWGVVDLYGMTVKVTIIDRSSDSDSNVGNMPQASLASPETPGPSMPRAAMDEETLLFHTLRDSNVIIVNNGTTAHRPSAFEIFSNGVVMTNRTLRTNELFEVRIDLIIPKWAGGIEIGVTQQNPNDIELPCNLSSGQSGTWAVVGSDVIRDGTVIIPQYVRNLNKLAEGDTVGVVRKDTGILHLYVNGEDQGPAAFNIPKNVYGVIDLYGKVAQVTIVKSFTPPPMDSPESPLSTESNATIYPDMCFHRVHGQNAQLSRNRLTATRSTVYSEFNDAVLFSCRPLRESDMFEIRIDKMVDCWIGSLEIGVTAIKPDDLEATGVGAVAGTATDLCWDTYILSGAAMMKDGECVRSGYPLDLDTLTVGSRVGMMWHSDRSLHFYLDGMDMGKAWYVPNLNIYAVVDLYGQCTQVTLLQNQERTFNSNGLANSDNSLLTNSRALPSPPTPYLSFSEYCGDNVNLLNDLTVARRRRDEPTSTLVFSSSHLATEEIFEIEILNCKHGYAGSFRMGMTDVNILNANVNRALPPTLAGLPHYTTYIDGRYMKYTKPNGGDRDIYSFVPSFEWLRPGDKIGFKKTKESNVHVYYNSELLDFAFEKVPDKVYVVMELSGHVTEIQAVSRTICVAHVQIQSGPNDDCNQNELAQDPNDAALPDNPLSLAQEEESAVATDVYESQNEEYGYQQYPYVPQTQEYGSQNYTTMPQNEAHGHNYGYMSQNGACGYQNFVPLPQNGTYACQNCVQYCPTLAQNTTCVYHNNAGVSQNLAGCVYHQTYPVAPHSGAYGYQIGCAVVPHNEAFTLQHYGYVSQNAAFGYQNCVSVPQNPACGYQCCANIPQNGYPACGVPVSHNVPCGYPNYVVVPQNGVYPYQPINQYVGVNQHEAYAYPNCVSYPQSDGYGYQNRAGITQEQYAYQNTTNMSHNETYGYPNYPAMQQTEVMGYQDCPTMTQPEALTYPDFVPGSQDEALTYPDYVPGSQDEGLTYPDYLPGSQNERLTYPNYVPGSRDEAYGYQDYAPVSENEFDFQNETYESENAVAVPEDSGSQYGDENPPEISESKTLETGEDGKDNDIPVAEVTEENQEQQDREVEEEQEKEIEQEQEEEVEQELDEEVEQEQEEEVEQEQEEEVEQEQKEVEQEYEKEIKQNIKEQVEQVEVLESDEIETPTESTSSELPVATSTAESAKPPLPYTFHFVHGKNIKLCSSDTVAFRTKGYNGAIAIVSQPLKRGNRFRFRVDKMTDNWSGSVTIGGVGTLPMEPLPDYAMHVDPPVWLVSSDMLNNNGRFSPTESACELDNIREQSVLTVLFNYNGDLMLDIDGVVSFVIANVPQIYNQIFPLIDLYGRVSQVSALLHPHVVTSGASLDLPMINEGNRNNRAHELETVEQDGTNRNVFSLGRRFTLKPKAYSQSNFVEDPMLAQPGPSSRPDPLPILNVTDDIENANRELKNRKVPNRLSLHASLIFTDDKTFSDDDGASNLRVQKSYSTFSFRDVANIGTNDSLRYAYNANTSSGRYNRLREQLSDTNIRHNDRYPEANDVDNLDNEIMDALTLETGNLPDLTEEHSSSLDDSIRHDDITSVTLTIANLNYLNRILCFDQDGVDGQSLESEWEASGEGCEHLHLVLKYWNFLVGPYPELRKAVSWGQVRCYCNNCQPDSRAPFAGWVRIERIDGVGAAQRGFWHVTQETLGSAQANSSERGPPRRPRTLTNNPCTSLSYSDVWYDEEGKPHQTILSIEIDIEGSDAENDRLLAFLIYLKPNMVQSDNSPTAEE